ncbi:CehA/McbA family metallohydrolase [Metabacillus herbersteinensis]|uniref:CehA/McbA family metallohydrolase n=1 Tax=Metabacillus herbersteinensis TaxID=283816 RepID=A0ABV6GH39_9BACI
MREEDEQILFEIQSTISKKSTQSHLKHTFFVPENTEQIYVDFSFDPPHQMDSIKNTRIIEEAFNYYESDLPTMDNEPVRNMLTLSIDDDDGFRGARHYHSPSQHVIVSENNSTPGYLNKKNPTGLWSVTVSIHALVTEHCHINLCIYRKMQPSNDNNVLNLPWQSKPLTQYVTENKLMISSHSSEKKSMYWLPSELHTHTFHSDGKQSVLEMATVAKDMGLTTIVISDHNTISPLQDIEKAKEATGIQILYGLEWTTFYGHMLTIGYKTPTYTDWRVIGPLNIEAGISEIRKHGALAGIAHPFRIGNPIGTGCHWEFPIETMNSFDFIEVWNSVRPGSKAYNKRAFQFWTDLLNKGYKLTATAGRDWHHNEQINPLPAISYVRMPKTLAEEKDAFRSSFLSSIRSGKVSLSYGKPLELTIQQGEDVYTIGEVIDNKTERLCAQVHSEQWASNERINKGSFRLLLFSNKGELAHGSPGNLSLMNECETEGIRWIRAELYASVDEEEIELIAFTNPVYFLEA